jgi:tetrathionate reductase subunit B
MMARYGMLIDLKSCNGCRACMTACKTFHGIPIGEQKGREYYRIWPQEVELGTYPYVVRNMTPLLCMQCADPPCTKACPIPGGIYQRADGIVLVNEHKCNGCKLCISACPYSALYFREDTGIVDKCTFCVENLDKGVLPECVKTCPAEAMFFGDLNDSSSQIAILIKKWDACPLHLQYRTEPSVYYTHHAGRLKGTIENKETGHAIQGVTVTLKRLDNTESFSTYTDSNGLFFFWKLEIGGDYLFVIEADGFPPIERKLGLHEEYLDLGEITI